MRADINSLCLVKVSPLLSLHRHKTSITRMASFIQSLFHFGLKITKSELLYFDCITGWGIINRKFYFFDGACQCLADREKI